LHIVRLLKEKQRLWRILRKAKKDNKNINEAKSAYKKCEDDCERESKKYIERTELCVVNSKNIRKLNSFLNQNLKTRVGIPPLRDANNITCVKDDEKAHILLEQYSNVFTRDDGVIPEFNLQTNNILREVKFTAEEVKSVLRNLPDKVSNTPDNIPAFFLKRVADNIADFLAKLFTLSMRIGNIPRIWKTAIVCPIFKKGRTDLAANYRPVSLTCVTCKVMDQLSKHDWLNICTPIN